MAAAAVASVDVNDLTDQVKEFFSEPTKTLLETLALLASNPPSPTVAEAPQPAGENVQSVVKAALKSIQDLVHYANSESTTNERTIELRDEAAQKLSLAVQSAMGILDSPAEDVTAVTAYQKSLDMMLADLNAASKAGSGPKIGSKRPTTVIDGTDIPLDPKRLKGPVPEGITTLSGPPPPQPAQPAASRKTIRQRLNECRDQLRAANQDLRNLRAGAVDNNAQVEIRRLRERLAKYRNSGPSKRCTELCETLCQFEAQPLIREYPLEFFAQKYENLWKRIEQWCYDGFRMHLQAHYFDYSDLSENDLITSFYVRDVLVNCRHLWQFNRTDPVTRGSPATEQLPAGTVLNYRVRLAMALVFRILYEEIFNPIRECFTIVLPAPKETWKDKVQTKNAFEAQGLPLEESMRPDYQKRGIAAEIERYADIEGEEGEEEEEENIVVPVVFQETWRKSVYETLSRTAPARRNADLHEAMQTPEITRRRRNWNVFREVELDTDRKNLGMNEISRLTVALPAN